MLLPIRVLWYTGELLSLALCYKGFGVLLLASFPYLKVRGWKVRAGKWLLGQCFDMGILYAVCFSHIQGNVLYWAVEYPVALGLGHLN